jgi:hypothetical protein
MAHPVICKCPLIYHDVLCGRIHLVRRLKLAVANDVEADDSVVRPGQDPHRALVPGPRPNGLLKVALESSYITCNLPFILF